MIAAPSARTFLREALDPTGALGFCTGQATDKPSSNLLCVSLKRRTTVFA